MSKEVENMGIEQTRRAALIAWPQPKTLHGKF
jgi:hypothetical protein